MGFFSNLFEGDFKSIYNNAVNNWEKGQIVSGTGFDSVINGAMNAITGGIGSPALKAFAKQHNSIGLTSDEAKSPQIVKQRLQTILNKKQQGFTNSQIQSFISNDLKSKQNKIFGFKQKNVIGFAAVVFILTYIKN